MHTPDTPLSEAEEQAQLMADFSQALADAAQRFKLPAGHPLITTIGAMWSYGLEVDSIVQNGLDASPERLVQYGLGDSLWMYDTIYVPEDFRQLDQPAQDRVMGRTVLLNLRQRRRLVNLLDEFYAQHTCPASIRLVAHSKAAGSSRVRSQDARIMALPHNEPHRQAWLEQARAEMQAFGDFLVVSMWAGYAEKGAQQHA